MSVRILLVDDEPDFRNAMAFSFKRMGYEVRTAANGREAYDMLLSEPADVVISDILMPGGDGIELLDRIKASNPGTPIILLVTGFADISAEEAHNRGAEAMFSKPLDKKALQETVSRLLTPADKRWAGQREHPELELKVMLKFPDRPEATEARVVNLGRGGMFVAVDKQTYPDANVTVSFDLLLDPCSPTDGEGVVRWVRTQSAPDFPAGCGIEFTWLSEHQLERVLSYLKANPPKAYIPNQ